MSLRLGEDLVVAFVSVWVLLAGGCAHTTQEPKSSGTAKARREVTISDPGCRRLVEACATILKDPERRKAYAMSSDLFELPIAEQRRLAASNGKRLADLHDALGKPIKVPPLDWDEARLGFVRCRETSKMLGVKEAVCFADGKSGEAVEALIDGLRLGQVFQQYCFELAAIGNACQSSVFEPAGRNLNRLSAQECRTILRAVRSAVRQPIPVDQMVAEEDRQNHADLLDLCYRTPDALLDGLEHRPGFASARAMQRADPQFFAKLINRSDAVRAPFYRAFAVELKKPFWQRAIREMTTTPDDPLTQLVIDLINGPDYFSIVSSRLTLHDTRLRLLGLHAAIAAYRLEHLSSPDTLSALNVPDLVTDPFCGQPFVYHRVGATGYVLYSVGPNMRDDGGKVAKSADDGGDVFLLGDGSR